MRRILLLGIQILFSVLITTPNPDTLNQEYYSETSISKYRYLTGSKYLTIESEEIIDTESGFSIKLGISWDASWRDYENYDAAWLFFKGRDKTGKWYHIKISNENLNFQYSNNNKALIEIAPDHMGFYVYRADIGQGSNQWTIQVDLEADKEIKEIKAYGLEMVYIPESTYELGTVKSYKDREEVLTRGAGGAPYNPFFTYKNGRPGNFGGPYKVGSEDPIEIGENEGSLFWIDADIPGANTFSGIPEGRLERSFPKGFKGFYAMKYELSQSEYCDFLNSLTPEQQSYRDFTETKEKGRPIADFRNTIYKEGEVYKSTRPHRPCNFISWRDGMAYADWAGLRHMTEMEFEKASRGPEKATYREYVWGENEIFVKSNMRYSTTITNPDGSLCASEDGTETTDGNNHTSMFSYYNYQDVCVPGSRFYDPGCPGCRAWEGGDGGRGPLRKGIFGSTSEGDRIRAGATYYGLLDMGGNLQEPVVTVGHPNGRRFRGSHGDGNLSANGEATNADWIPQDGDYAFGGRGGCWKFHENHARTADRFKGLRTNENRRASHIGFRGVRTQ